MRPYNESGVEERCVIWWKSHWHSSTFRWARQRKGLNCAKGIIQVKQFQPPRKCLNLTQFSTEAFHSFPPQPPPPPLWWPHAQWNWKIPQIITRRVLQIFSFRKLFCHSPAKDRISAIAEVFCGKSHKYNPWAISLEQCTQFPDHASAETSTKLHWIGVTTTNASMLSCGDDRKSVVI